MPEARSRERQRPSHRAAVPVVCVLVAFIQSTNAYLLAQGRYGWWVAMAFMLVTCTLMAAGWRLLVRLATAYSFAYRRARSIAVHLAAVLVFASVHNIVLALSYVMVLASFAPAPDQFAWHFAVTLKYYFFQDVLIYAALVAMYLSFRYAELRAQLADARLTALRAQLNPHFFFNTLNAVSSLALQGRQDEVAEVVGRLGDLMRTALQEQAQEVRLSRELAFVDDYLAIQHVRLGERLRVKMEIAPETLDALVPSLIIQPIVENALEYGRAGDTGTMSVNVRTSRQGDHLLVEICDTGPGFAMDVRREGIGLANTRARLQELYGDRCRFVYGNVPGGGASIRMSFPFRVAAAAAPDQATTNHESRKDWLHSDVDSRASEVWPHAG